MKPPTRAARHGPSRRARLVPPPIAAMLRAVVDHHHAHRTRAALEALPPFLKTDIGYPALDRLRTPAARDTEEAGAAGKIVPFQGRKAVTGFRQRR